MFPRALLRSQAVSNITKGAQRRFGGHASEHHHGPVYGSTHNERLDALGTIPDREDGARKHSLYHYWLAITPVVITAAWVKQREIQKDILYPEGTTVTEHHISTGFYDPLTLQPKRTPFGEY